MARQFFAMVLIAGAALSAAPAIVQAADMPCPAMPEPGNTSSGKVGGGGVQLGGLGVSGTRERSRVFNDVVIQAEGTSGYNNLVYYHQACLVILKLYPGDVRRQWAEMSLFRNTQFRASAPTQPAAVAASPPIQTASTSTEETARISRLAALALGPRATTAPREAETPQPTARYEVHSEADRRSNCAGNACIGGSTLICTSIPQASYNPTLTVGGLVISGLINTSSSGSCFRRD